MLNLHQFSVGLLVLCTLFSITLADSANFTNQITPSQELRSQTGCVAEPDGSMAWMLGGYYDLRYFWETYSTSNGGQTWQQQNSTGASSRYSSGAALLASGALIWFGGIEGSSASNEVQYSIDNGNNWRASIRNSTDSSAPWEARSDFAFTSIPNSNRVYVISGNGESDVWSANDATASVWTRLTRTAPFNAVSSAGLVSLTDGTLILAGGRNGSLLTNAVWSSTDLGYTWQALPNATWSPRYEHVMITDSDNLIYVFGGLTSLDNGISGQTSSELWISNDGGYTWHNISLNNPPPAQSHGCAFIRSVSNQKVLSLYAGKDSTFTPLGTYLGTLDLSVTFNGTLSNRTFEVSSTGGWFDISSSGSEGGLSSSSNIEIERSSSTGQSASMLNPQPIHQLFVLSSLLALALAFI